MIKAISGLLAASASLFLFVGSVSAQHHVVTPYGDYCKYCTAYGACRKVLSPSESVEALEEYYASRGYRVGDVRQKGRFMEADIFKGNDLADKVLFDRKTGRIRSVH